MGIPLCAAASMGSVLGYLDPGSGSLLLQMMIAGMLSGLVFAKSTFQYVRASVLKK